MLDLSTATFMWTALGLGGGWVVVKVWDAIDAMTATA
jgi:hypothetical protein